MLPFRVDYLAKGASRTDPPGGDPPLKKETLPCKKRGPLSNLNFPRLPRGEPPPGPPLLGVPLPLLISDIFHGRPIGIVAIHRALVGPRIPPWPR